MDNYDYDVAHAEQEQMKSNGYVQTTGGSRERLATSFGIVWSRYSVLVAHRLRVVYRRASTRAAGLVLNTLQGLRDMAPGRT